MVEEESDIALLQVCVNQLSQEVASLPQEMGMLWSLEYAWRVRDLCKRFKRIQSFSMEKVPSHAWYVMLLGRSIRLHIRKNTRVLEKLQKAREEWCRQRTLWNYEYFRRTNRRLPAAICPLIRAFALHSESSEEGSRRELSEWYVALKMEKREALYFREQVEMECLYEFFTALDQPIVL